MADKLTEFLTLTSDDISQADDFFSQLDTVSVSDYVETKVTLSGPGFYRRKPTMSQLHAAARKEDRLRNKLNQCCLRTIDAVRARVLDDFELESHQAFKHYWRNYGKEIRD